MNDDERHMRMAEDLVDAREGLAKALRCLMVYAEMFDATSPVETFMFGRTTWQIETLKRIYEDLDPMKGVDE
jgi:hypothetical protein